MLPIIVLAFFCVPVASEKDVLGWCLDAHNHKSKPGKESDLYKQCVPWKNRACCTANTTYHVHHGDMYGFDIDHCQNQGKPPLSDLCRTHFNQDLCFYECSPNIGPWVVKVDMKIRKERFYQVPLCMSDCEAWFRACKGDYTCTDNWARNMRWKDGKNFCPLNSECRTFKEIYRTAKYFCQQIWDGSWLPTDDNESCMRIWFDGSKGNPNDVVARYKIQDMDAARSAASGLSLLPCAVITSAVTLVLWRYNEL